MMKFPEGLLWKLTEKLTIESRKKKYNLFLQYLNPKPEDKILDTGISSYSCRCTNFLEIWYPYKKHIIALTNGEKENYKHFMELFPEVKLIFGDARKLDFSDNNFDIAFSNAVVEHSGSRRQQKQFIHEIIRVSKRAFITTPNRWFPIDFHTLMPFAHWMPQRIKALIYSFLSESYFASLNNLNLLNEKEFLSLFPKEAKVKIVRQRILGITSTIIAIVEKR